MLEEIFCTNKYIFYLLHFSWRVMIHIINPKNLKLMMCVSHLLPKMNILIAKELLLFKCYKCILKLLEYFIFLF